MNLLLIILLSLSQITFDPERPVQKPRINGSIEYADGHRIVNVWGSHYEMGYAHGYLLGPQIMMLVEEYGLNVITNAYYYENYLLTMVTYAFTCRQEYTEELQGMYEGMQARGADMYLDALDRDLTRDDLFAMNLIPDISRYGCSVAFGWGDATADDPELQGGSVMVRDLDWGHDPSGLLYTQGILLVCQSDSPDEKGFVSVTWPGLISVISGISSDGMGATINYGNHNGYGTLLPKHFHGIGFSIRDGLEDRDYDNDGFETHLDLYASISANPVLSSFEISLIGPYPVPGHPGADAAGVLEINNLMGFALRDTSHNMLTTPALDSDCLLAVTNHHRLLYPPVFCNRYSYQVNQLSIDFKVDTEELWDIEAAISHSGTMHMTAFRPNLLDMFVAFNETKQGAANSLRKHYRLADLFPNH